MLGRRHQGLLLILSKRHTSLQVKTHAGIYEHYEYVRPYEQTKHIGFPTLFTLLPIV